MEGEDLLEELLLCGGGSVPAVVADVVSKYRGEFRIPAFTTDDLDPELYLAGEGGH